MTKYSTGHIEHLSCGERHGQARLTWTDIDAIRSASANGISGHVLSKRYEMDRRQIRDILLERAWRPECHEGQLKGHGREWLPDDD